MQKFLLRN